MIRDLLRFYFYIDIIQTKCLIQILLVLTSAHIARVHIILETNST